MVNTTATTPADAAGSTVGADDAVYAQLTTREGWRRFVDDVPVVPDLLSPQAWRPAGPAAAAGLRRGAPHPQRTLCWSYWVTLTLTSGISCCW
jgi:hypothetical protein